MSNPDRDLSPGLLSEEELPPGNTVASIGLILTVVACLMCGVLFAAARGLPDSKTAEQEPSDAVESTSADQTDSEDADEQDEEVLRKAEEARAAEKAELDAQRLRVLLLASTTAVLNMVGLVLSVIGLFVPGRPRAVAIGGTILSLMLFAGVFGVMVVGALLNPGVVILF